MSNRKTLSFMLTVILALSMILVGCGRNNNTDTNGTNSNAQSGSSSVNDNSSGANGIGENDTELGADNNNGNNGTNGTDENGTNNNDANNNGNTVAGTLADTIENVYNDVMNGADNWLGEMDENTMKTAYDMDFSYFDEYYGRIPQKNTHATSVIGVKVKDGKKAEARAELMKYQAAMEKNFERYLPDQYDLVKDYRIIENGDYMVLVIADNADDIETAFGDAFKNMQ